VLLGGSSFSSALDITDVAATTKQREYPPAIFFLLVSYFS
jgi:hypothetical protein